MIPEPLIAAAEPPPSLPARGLLLLVRLYQAARAGRPSPCRYDPSCSAYAATALVRFGAARGAWLAARRLGRCHPWGGFGPDPVPEAARPAPTGAGGQSPAGRTSHQAPPPLRSLPPHS